MVVVLPGKLVKQGEDGKEGTYVLQNRIYASILGDVVEDATGVKVNGMAVMSVLPQVQDTVLCRVQRITSRMAYVAIIVVNDVPCKGEFAGIIRYLMLNGFGTSLTNRDRSQDIRATDKDDVKVFASFRPGDIVRAQILSLGEERSYLLTTAANEMGVVYATSSQAHAPMYPINWKEMKCSATGEVELRKCAKPF